jgi:AAA domain
MKTINDLTGRYKGNLKGNWHTFDECPACGGKKCGIHIGADGKTLGGVSCWREPERNSEATRVVRSYDNTKSQPPTKPPARGLTLAQYSALKNLPVDFLEGLGVSDSICDGVPSVRFPYYTPEGKAAGYKHRKAAHLHDFDQATKWRGHIKGCDLYGLERFPEPPEYIVIVEGESCTDTLHLNSINAIGTSGKKSWKEEFASHPIFEKAEANKQIFVVQEPEAEDFSTEVCESFGRESVRVITLPEKDSSELWLACKGDAETFAEEWEMCRALATPRKRLWEDAFLTAAQLECAPPRELIRGVMSEGLAYNGAGSFVGKTWKTMSCAAALRSGRKFAGVYEVPERVNVIYLMAEEGNASVYDRAKLLRMDLHDPNLRFHTLTHGVMTLNDRRLLKAVKDLRPCVVYLDTAIRFANVRDENSAAENAGGIYSHLAELMRAGAIAVECNHHTLKNSIRGGQLLELEDLRGTGDIGAMCDTVWMLQTYRGDGTPGTLERSKANTIVLCRNVKARHLKAEPFVLIGRPNINRDGDFGVLDEHLAQVAAKSDPRGARMAEEAKKNPTITNTALSKLVKCSPNDVPKMMAAEGWFRQPEPKGPWVHAPILVASHSEADEDVQF